MPRSRTGPYAPKHADVKKAALEAYANGMRIIDIVTRFGVSKGYVYRVMMREGIPKRPQKFNTRNKVSSARRIGKPKKLIPYAGKEV
jgi:transposase